MRELASYHQLCNSGLELSPVPGASSDTSSPRSSTTEDDLHEVNYSEQGACNTTKPIYNFSIPDFIKHERQPAPSAANNITTSQPSALPDRTGNTRDTKRRHDDIDSVEAVQVGELPRTNSRSSCRKNKRRRVDQTGNAHNPDFIDLTDVTDQDEAASVRVLEEINHSPYLDSSIVLDANRPPSDRRQQTANSYESVAENLQRFRRTLRETLIRREANARESRMFNRLSHPSNPCTDAPRVISDGPAYTPQRDIGPHQVIGNPPSFDFRNAEPPVITLDEEAETPTRNRDHEVTRMLLEDSLYSLPFVAPYQNRLAPPLETIEEDIDRREERRRENENHVHRLRQQTQERINHVRNRISRLEQHVNSSSNNNNRNGFFIRISDSPQENRSAEDEVEFLRELRPPQNTSTMSARPNEAHASSHSNLAWLHLTYAYELSPGRIPKDGSQASGSQGRLLDKNFTSNQVMSYFSRQVPSLVSEPFVQHKESSDEQSLSQMKQNQICITHGLLDDGHSLATGATHENTLCPANEDMVLHESMRKFSLAPARGLRGAFAARCTLAHYQREKKQAFMTYNQSHLSRRRRFSNLFSTANLGVPDFLFPYVHFINPSATPRLHHFPSTFYDEGEDYEALWTLAERIGPAKPRGLSKTEIDRIHAFRYSASKADETNSTCVVCMSEYSYKEKIRKLPCTHDFHSKCIDKWLKSNKTCPVCRDEVRCM
eukprot:gene11608-21845_t